jgi:hypothetical protein
VAAKLELVMICEQCYAELQAKGEPACFRPAALEGLTRATAPSPPGCEGKLLVMMQRAERRQCLFHPLDHGHAAAGHQVGTV